MTSLTQISTALYRYLCQHVVGTEESVKTKRMLNTVFDSFLRHPSDTYMTSGSFGEGLEMKGSDLDVMYITRKINVYECTEFNYDPKKKNFIMETEGTKPGFTKLKLVNVDRVPEIHKLCIKTGNDFYLSNILIYKHDELVPLNRKFTVHGPCVSDGNIDIAVSLQSKTWITPASHWLHRAHNEWPLEDVKLKIVKCGLLFVPVGVKGSDKEEFEWRISFSAAEKLLIYSFNHTQLLCYALMKILLKDIIEKDSRCTSKLCSYYIKTMLFWVSEEQPLSVWRPDNLIPCFMRCFQRLIYCVKYSFCPHYFIPENNMFENKIEGFVRQVLLENLSALYSNGWQCLLTSQQLSNFTPFTPLHVEFNTFQDNFRHTLKSIVMKRRFLQNWRGPCENCLKMGMYGITHFLQYQSSNIKSYCAYGLSQLSLKIAQEIQLTTQKRNKETYKRYNTCLAYLLLSTHHDAVSGWLMLASFFYKMKQYRLALNILSYSLSKCTSEKIKFEEIVCAQECYKSTLYNPVLSHKTLKSMGIPRTIATLVLEPVLLTSRNELIPNELEMFVKSDQSGPVILHDIFAHFLCFLCHYHLHDVRQYRSSLRDLYQRKTQDFTLSDLLPIITIHVHGICGICDTFMKYCFLGIAYELIRDYDSARDAFLTALKNRHK